MQRNSILARFTASMLGSETDRDLIFMMTLTMMGLVVGNLRLLPNQVEAQAFLAMLGLL